MQIAMQAQQVQEVQGDGPARLPELKEEYHFTVQAIVMLTPSFNVNQNEEFVILNIRVPYIKVMIHCSWE